MVRYLDKKMSVFYLTNDMNDAKEEIELQMCMNNQENERFI